MKKLLIFTVLLFGSITLMAQHINFLGKPLGCSISTFKQRMTEKGYKCNGEVEPTVYSFDGVFGGDQVLVAAYLTQKSHIVYSVGVFYTNYRSFSYDDNSKSDQRFKYYKLIESFIKKYGEPDLTNDEFVQWNQEFGEILIIINGNESDSYRNLIVWYQDKEGGKKRIEENESDY